MLVVADPGNPGKTLALPSAPNELALDKHGNVWFTELNAGAVGRLDPRSGHIQQYPLSAKKSAQALNPYGVAVDPQGIVWFTESNTNHVRRLPPTTAQPSYFTTHELATHLID